MLSSGGWLSGRRILRSAPWLPLLGSATAAAVLLLIAALAHRTAIALVTTLLGLSTCGATAAYVLDEETAAVADATPTSRRRRLAWRMPIVALPAAVALAGLLVLNRLDPPTHWLRLVPLAAGALAIGVGLAAALRRNGAETPGDQAGVLALAATLLVVAFDPLRRWVTVAPLGQAAHPGRSAMLWIVVIVVCGAVTVTCSRDPGRRGNPGRRPRRRTAPMKGQRV